MSIVKTVMLKHTAQSPTVTVTSSPIYSIDLHPEKDTLWFRSI